MTQTSIAALDRKVKRLEVQSAIKDDLIKSLRETVEHYRSAFYHEFTRNNRLTSAVGRDRVAGTRNETGESFPVRGGE